MGYLVYSLLPFVSLIVVAGVTVGMLAVAAVLWFAGKDEGKVETKSLRLWLVEDGWKVWENRPLRSGYALDFLAEHKMGFGIEVMQLESNGFLEIAAPLNVEGRTKMKLDGMTDDEVVKFYSELKLKMAEAAYEWTTDPVEGFRPRRVIPHKKLQLESVTRTSFMDGVRNVGGGVSLVKGYFNSKLGIEQPKTSGSS